ncbi:MAG: filamentous hemagglutinin N-terminal domain-containing protein [Actinomycetota bacterium]
MKLPHPLLTSTISLLLLAAPQSAIAQIIPDATLPNPSITIPNGNTIKIEGGTRNGGNLFHSFQEFSVPTGGTAFFNNATDIQTIFSRVTGGKISNIDGLIKANGTANLFFLNPAGLVFGPNATLNIGGSFFATTANSIHFADGITFSAVNPQATNLLTINVPIGLQFGNNPGSIINQSRTTLPDTPLPVGLAVQPGQTLTLAGGNLLLQGGNLTASGGRIELSAIGPNNLVSLTSIPNHPGLALNPQGVQNFQDIQLLGGATVNTSGEGGGTIQLQGRRIAFQDRSTILALTLGDQPGGTIAVNASESFSMIGRGGYDDIVRKFVSGKVSQEDFQSGIFTLALGSGNAGSVTINAPQVTTQNGTYVSTSTFGQGAGGRLTVNASKIEMSASFFATGTGLEKSGDSGDLTVNTDRLTLRDNAVMTTITLGAGRGGDISVNASDSVEIIGSNPIQITPVVRAFTGFFSSSLGSGNAGQLRVNTNRISILNGAGLAASAFGEGDGGNITIQATKTVELKGASPNGLALSSIAAVTEPGSAGKGGNVTVQAQRVTLENGGRLSVRSRGTGRTGNLEVVADSVRFSNEGGLEGTAVAGEGANLTVRSRNLQLQQNSFISATAGTEGGPGNGGNININTDTLSLLGNSSISANAFSGSGGNIRINTQGNFVTQNSKITASSQLGVSGVIDIQTPGVNPSQGLVALPQNFTDVRGLIASSCDKIQGNEFTITGRGGLPEDPTNSLRGQAIWQDLRVEFGEQPQSRTPQVLREKSRESTEDPSLLSSSHLPPQLLEATTWEVNAQGEVMLVAKATNHSPQNSWYRNPNCRN